MLKRFIRNECGIISVDVVALEKSLKIDPISFIEEVKKESQERFDEKFPKEELIK